MKKINTYFKALVITSILMIFTSSIISGQVFIKEGSATIDRHVTKGEEVQVEIESFRGSLQWQESTDGTNWDDIDGQNEALLNYTPNQGTYLRASVKEENCDPVFSNVVHLITAVLPTVVTGNITDISSSTAWCGGAVTDDGGELVYTRGFCWSIDPMPTIAGDHLAQGTGVGTFGNLITGLGSDTLYYIRTYASNSIGTAYGEQKEFKTLVEVILPTVSTTAITNITHNSAASGGVVTSDGRDSLTVSGVCWNTSKNPTIANNFTTDSIGVGSFTSFISGLVDSTKYYVRAYAQNQAGITYGEQLDFKTFKTPVLPTVLTNLITVLAVDSAVGGGEVTLDGGAMITARGICWNTTGNPRVNDSITLDGTGRGEFLSTMLNLDERSDYYFRAYATNNVGTSYGEEIRFTTASSDWDGTFTDPRDNKIYGYVTIGTQTWMAENLGYQRLIHMPDDGSTTLAKYYVYDYEGELVADAKSSENYYTYGTLYNWVAARRSCPAGWHLPTDVEWKDLEVFLEMTTIDVAKTGWRFSGDVGGKLRSSTHWANSSYQGLDSEGFTALPGGKRETDSIFKLQTEFGYFWTATANGSSNAYARSMWHTVGALNRYGADRQSGFSVRCVKD